MRLAARSKTVGAACALAATCAALLAACGGGQTRSNLFMTDWSDDGGVAIDRVRARLAGTRPPPGANVVLGVAGNGSRLIGLPLDVEGGGNAAGAHWTFTHRIDGRPVVAGSLVVATGGGELFALDAKTGNKIWVRQTGGLPLRGAGDDGTITAVSLGRASEAMQGSTLLVIARDGSVTRQIETEKELGVPAVVGGLAFVPWGDQYVSVFDITNGDEPARVLLREKTSRAWTQNGTLYFGEVGMFRFDDRIGLASRNQASHVDLPERELPGSPVLMTPPRDRQTSVASARDKIRLYARPGSPDAPLAMDADRFYATYFRYVMGFEAKKGKLEWVRSVPADVIGGAAAHGALVTCDEQGKVAILDAAHGGTYGERDLGEAVQTCTVSVDGFLPSGTPRDAGTLVNQLASAIELRDAQLATAKRVLLHEMASLQDEVATKVLVDLVESPTTSPLVLADARKALASRRNGVQYMTAALDRHYDYLHDVLEVPPVGPIAQALAAMKAKAAAPLLASHLLDPADTEDDVRDVADALRVIGAPEALPALKQFVVLYHAAADTDEMEAAVESAAQALLESHDSDLHAVVDRVAADPLTNDAVRAKLQAALKAEKAAADKASSPPQTK